jgi:hypothetical protein
MSCNLNSGILLGCRDNTGGIKTAWITDFTNIDSVTQSTGSTITQISGSGTFYEFQLIRTSSSFVETATASLEAGTVFYTDELALYFAKMTQEKTNILKTLAQSQRLAVVFEDNNGGYWYQGQTYGSFISAATQNSGKGLGDANGLNFTLQALEPNPINSLSGSLASIAQGITVQDFN